MNFFYNLTHEYSDYISVFSWQLFQITKRDDLIFPYDCNYFLIMRVLNAINDSREIINKISNYKHKACFILFYSFSSLVCSNSNFFYLHE